MNKSDSERIATVLDSLGYESVVKPEFADLVILNACSVRQTAIDRIWGFAKGLRRYDENKKLILTGCLLEEDKLKLASRFNLIFNIKQIDVLRRFLAMEMTPLSVDYFAVKPKLEKVYRAFVPIMTGCDNYCSYCVVPYTRGHEKSRAVSDVLNEIKLLVKEGTVEIELLGQNVNSYAPADLASFSSANPFTHAFAKLLWEVNQIDGLVRVYFSSAHPRDMTDEVIRAMALPKQGNYLHLAMQSGDDEILARMNRRYTADDYRQLVKKIRAVRPEIALGTDIIVGFCGETEDQYENTLNLYKELDLDISFHAQFSSRAGTVAGTWDDDVSKEEKERRWKKLQALVKKITLAKNQFYVGREVQVLVDDYKNGEAIGNSSEMKRVRFVSPVDCRGQMLNVKINKAMEWILEGERVN